MWKKQPCRCLSVCLAYPAASSLQLCFGKKLFVFPGRKGALTIVSQFRSTRPKSVNSSEWFEWSDPPPQTPFRCKCIQGHGCISPLSIGSNPVLASHASAVVGTIIGFSCQVSFINLSSTRCNIAQPPSTTPPQQQQTRVDDHVRLNELMLLCLTAHQRHNSMRSLSEYTPPPFSYMMER